MDKGNFSAFKFYWLCIMDAASSTIEKRYVWAWGIGAGFLWAILSAVALTQIETPTTLGGAANLEIAFGIASIAFAWGVIFSLRLIAAPTRLYYLAQDENKELSERVGTLEKSLRPKIELVFDANVEKCKGLEKLGILVRILAFNRGAYPLEDCEARLISLEVADKNGTFRSVGYESRMNLSWARSPDGDPNKYGKIRLADGPEPEPIDVFHAVPRPPDSHESNLLQLRVQSFDPRWTIKHGKYRLGIQGLAKDNTSAHITLLVEWAGNCQDIRVWSE